MFRSANLKDFDWAMLFIVLVVCGLGVLQIFSATQNTIWQGAWWKQLATDAARGRACAAPTPEARERAGGRGGASNNGGGEPGDGDDAW